MIMKKPLLNQRGFLKVYQNPIPVHFFHLFSASFLQALPNYKMHVAALKFDNTESYPFPGQSLQPN